jgi:hypothetical protein
VYDRTKEGNQIASTLFPIKIVFIALYAFQRGENEKTFIKRDRNEIKAFKTSAHM